MNKPFVIQALFAVCFGLLLVRLLVLAGRGQVPRNRAAIWTLVWGSGLLLVLNPKLSFHLAHALGVTRGTDAVTYTAIAFLSVMVFRSFQLIDSQDREMSRLTTQLALYEWEHARERPKSSGRGKPRGADLPPHDEQAPA